MTGTRHKEKRGSDGLDKHHQARTHRNQTPHTQSRRPPMRPMRAPRPHSYNTRNRPHRQPPRPHIRPGRQPSNNLPPMPPRKNPKGDEAGQRTETCPPLSAPDAAPRTELRLEVEKIFGVGEDPKLFEPEASDGIG
nr:MAG TPA: hypothetical protein [Caudoviricetes sp.]